jgi:hypothetical protein
MHNVLRRRRARRLAQRLRRRGGHLVRRGRSAHRSRERFGRGQSRRSARGRHGRGRTGCRSREFSLHRHCFCVCSCPDFRFGVFDWHGICHGIWALEGGLEPACGRHLQPCFCTRNASAGLGSKCKQFPFPSTHTVPQQHSTQLAYPRIAERKHWPHPSHRRPNPSTRSWRSSVCSGSLHRPELGGADPTAFPFLGAPYTPPTRCRRTRRRECAPSRDWQARGRRCSL